MRVTSALHKVGIFNGMDGIEADTVTCVVLEVESVVDTVTCEVESVVDTVTCVVDEISG